MAVWDGEVGKLCRRNGIRMRFRRRYVDDCNGAMESWREGWRWNGSKMEWREEWEREDLAKGEERDVRCWREWAKMVDTIWPFIQVTFDCPGLNQSRMVPILDLQVKMTKVEEVMEGGARLEYQQIEWRFYEKPMNSPYVIMERSAMPQQVKITSMVQEVIRRKRNFSRMVPEEEVKWEMSRFCAKMKRSGYSEGVRRDVLLSGIKGYEKMLRNEREGRRKLYRKQEEGKELRWAMKIKGKETWYKQRKREEGGDGDKGEEQKRGICKWSMVEYQQTGGE